MGCKRRGGDVRSRALPPDADRQNSTRFGRSPAFTKPPRSGPSQGRQRVGSSGRGPTTPMSACAAESCLSTLGPSAAAGSSRRTPRPRRLSCPKALPFSPAHVLDRHQRHSTLSQLGSYPPRAECEAAPDGIGVRVVRAQAAGGSRQVGFAALREPASRQSVAAARISGTARR